MNKTDVLRQYFGHSSFRYGQEEIIDSILSGRDSLGVMPTGAGKSMCYQIPALMMEGTTIVISPLISLMKDQVEALVQSGVPAAYINTSLSKEQYLSTLDYIASGQCRILYVAPERLAVERFVSLCSSINVPLVAVDEAHCVSQWGQDFRPSYLKISEFISMLPKRPVLAAFTATATKLVRQDIVEILALNDPFRITTGFDRENLYFEVRSLLPSEKQGVLLRILREAAGRSAIVYCSTRKNVDDVYQFLNLNSIAAQKYHAGLSGEERRKAQEDFIYDRVNVIVATNAFGMGIDKSDVALVVHYNMPKDIESYYQEAGRAGRDGSPARCILLYSKSDVKTSGFIIDHGYEDSELTDEQIEELKERDRERLKQMTFYCTTNRCQREFMLRYFGERTGDFCGNCGNCNKLFDTVDRTIAAQKIISCVFRLGQRGAVGSMQLVTDILEGRKTAEIFNADYQTLSTYGIMKGQSEELAVVLDYLMNTGYLEQQEDGLHSTDLAQEFIKKRRSLLMKIPKRRDVRDIEVISEAVQQQTEVNPELFNELKALRKKIAATLGVPAYVVFTDASLREMSAKMPMTTAEFMNISGVGSRKAERYSKQFAKVIGEYKGKL